MADSDCLHPQHVMVELKLGHVEQGLNLSAEACWNQVGDDWRFFIEHGKVFGFLDEDQRLIASAAALPHDSRFGFVSMVLVTKRWRRNGLATRLVNRCIEWLDRHELMPVLDATADGARVYVRQGFVSQFALDRWQLVPSGGPDAPVPAPDVPWPASEDSLPIAELVALDARATGAARPRLIGDFLARSTTRLFVSPGRNGFAIMRRGRNALQVGPLVASSSDVAISLVQKILCSTDEPIFVDVPAMAVPFGQWLKSMGFTVQRSFERMALGRSLPFGRPAELFSSAGPEFG